MTIDIWVADSGSYLGVGLGLLIGFIIVMTVTHFTFKRQQKKSKVKGQNG